MLKKFIEKASISTFVLDAYKYIEPSEENTKLRPIQFKFKYNNSTKGMELIWDFYHKLGKCYIASKQYNVFNEDLNKVREEEIQKWLKQLKSKFEIEYIHPNLVIKHPKKWLEIKAKNINDYSNYNGDIDLIVEAFDKHHINYVPTDKFIKLQDELNKLIKMFNSDRFWLDILKDKVGS